MANRTVEIGGIWAEGAPDVPLEDPIPGTTYANTVITEETINEGWPYTNIITSNDFNEVMRRITLLLSQLESQGVLSYSILTDYVIGALVMGSDGVLYRAIVLNGPSSTEVDPVGNPGTWEDIHN